MQIMQYRHDELNRALAALNDCGVPLVSLNDGKYQPSGNGDDLGIYYFVPKVAQLFDVPTVLALDIFYYTILGAALLCGAIGSLFCCRTWAGRATAIAWLTSIVCMTSVWNDVYLVAPCIAMALVPWLVWSASSGRGHAVLIPIALALGVLVSVGNQLRSHSGTGVLLFGLILVLGAHSLDWRRRAIFALVAIAGFAGPQLYFSHLVRQRDAFLATKIENYEPGGVRHAFWHPVYLGLGFLRNQYDLVWDDGAAMKAAEAVRPGVVYLSPEYSEALKEQSIAVYKRDKVFVYRTVFAKAGIVFYYFLRYAGAGLLVFWLLPRNLPYAFAFAAGIAFSGLPGVIGIPDEVYLIGFMAFASLFSAMTVAAAIDHGLIGLPAMRPLSIPWFAARPAVVRAIPITLGIVVIVIAARVAEKKTERTWKVLSGFVQSSRQAAEAERVLAMAHSSALTDDLDETQIDWQPVGAEVSVSREDGDLILVGDARPHAYQAEARIDMEGVHAAVVEYELEITEGAAALGILDSQGQWIKVDSYTKPGAYRNQLPVYVLHDSAIKLIISNGDSAVSAHARLRDLTVKRCAETGPEQVANREEATVR